MSEGCNLCKGSDVMVLACAGGSNVGQITNSAAVEITNEGKGRMYCLAGLGGHVQGLIDNTNKADKVIVVDGCPVGCAKRIVEHAGIRIDGYIEISREGMEKTPGNLGVNPEQVSRIKELIEKKIEE